MSLKHRVRDVGARALFGLGLSAPARTARDRLTIATFHRVLTAQECRASPFPGLAVTPELLDGCLAFFTEHFTCLPLAEAWSAFQRGERPARPLLSVTFDDGRQDNFDRARPALARHGVNGTFFIPAGFVGSRELMWHDALAWGVDTWRKANVTDARAWLAEALRGGRLPGDDAALAHAAVAVVKDWHADDRDALLEHLVARAGRTEAPDWERAMGADALATLAAEGHEIGSHSMSHAVLLERLGADLEQEVSGARSRLQELLGLAVDGFCFPTGLYDGATLDAVAAAGHSYAVTTRWGGNPAGAKPFELRRFDIEGRRNATAGGTVDRSVLAWRLSELPGAPA
jgi:peptidoglycan/xylan/chitin deacetylase (PgdA/CDA1 family)